MTTLDDNNKQERSSHYSQSNDFNSNSDDDDNQTLSILRSHKDFESNALLGSYKEKLVHPIVVTTAEPGKNSSRPTDLTPETLLEVTTRLTRTEGNDTTGSSDKQPVCSCFTPQCQVYISHFLSSWGDRMWMFAGGLFLIEITPGSLRLVAIYESALSLTIIFFGSAIGRWVDRTSRLRAAQSSLVLQNLMVCACTLLLCLLISYKTYFADSLNGWGTVTAQAGVVLLACVAQAGSLGSTLAIEKDWIIVISEDRKVNLSTMNSVLRTVDLSTEMLAPVLVGFVMAWAGMVTGGIFIASWNVASLIFEYGLLHHLFYKVAALRKLKGSTVVTTDAEEGNALTHFLKETRLKMKDAVVTWKLYFSHEIRDAGLALAFLFMTVISLDNYSRAYVYENGVSKGILGILTAVASVSGICGSLAFPYLRKKVGVLQTGIFGFVFETFCLLFCVASVFAPGTTFQPLAKDPTVYQPIISTGRPPSQLGHPIGKLVSENRNMNDSSPVANTTTVRFNLDGHVEEPDMSPSNVEQTEEDENGTVTREIDYTSIALLLTGMLTSRFGLWLADLTVTQILQEQVSETERGGINGVQSSLNQTFSLLRSVLIIILPTLGTFGYLILLSFAFVAIASMLFSLYAYRTWKKALPT